MVSAKFTSGPDVRVEVRTGPKYSLVSPLTWSSISHCKLQELSNTTKLKSRCIGIPGDFLAELFSAAFLPIRIFSPPSFSSFPDIQWRQDGSLFLVLYLKQNNVNDSLKVNTFIIHCKWQNSCTVCTELSLYTAYLYTYMAVSFNVCCLTFHSVSYIYRVAQKKNRFLHHHFATVHRRITRFTP